MKRPAGSASRGIGGEPGGGSVRAARVRRVGMVLLLLLALTPLVYLPGFLFPYVVPRAFYVRVGIAAGAAILLWAGGTGQLSLEDPRDPILWTLAAFAAVSSLAALLGPAPGWSFFGGLERMWGSVQWIYLLAFYAMLRTFPGGDEWPLLLRVTVYVAAAVAVYGIFEHVVGVVLSASFSVAVDSTLGNQGYVGPLMLLAGGSAAVLASREGRELPRWGLATIAALFAVVVVLTGRRAPLLGGAMGGVAAASIVGASRAMRLAGALRWLAGGAVAVTAATGTVYLLAPESLSGLSVLTRFAEVDPASGTLATRIHAWKAGLEGVAVRPLTGWGGENFHLVFDRFVDPRFYRLSPGHTLWDRAHNVLVGKLVQSGPAGLLAYLGFWGSLLWLTLRGWREDSLGALEAAGLLFAFTGTFVFLQFWFEDHSSALLMITLAAYLRHRVSRRPLVAVEPSETSPARKNAIWGAAGAILVVAVAWSTGRAALSARHVQKAETASGLEETVRQYERARRLARSGHHQVALRYASVITELGLTSGRVLRRPDSLRALYSRGVEGADRALGRTARSDPLDGRLDARRGRLASAAAMVFAGERIQRMARESLAEAIEKSPSMLEHRHALAEVEALFGDPEEGSRILREALDVYDGYGRTYYLLAQMQDEGDDEAVRRHLRRSFWLGYFPGDEEAPFLRRTLDELVRGGKADRAEELLSAYFAERYLPPLREKSDRFGEERRGVLANVSADVEPAGQEYRPYEIRSEDLPLVAIWPRVAVEAGECRRAGLAMRLILNGLSEAKGTARLRPVLSRQLERLRDRCSV